MKNIDLNLTKYERSEKPVTHDIRFNCSFDDEAEALSFFTKLSRFVELAKKETNSNGRH